MLKSEDEEEKHSPFLPLSSSLPVRSGISIGSMRSSSVSSKSTTVWAPSKSRSNTISSSLKEESNIESNIVVNNNNKVVDDDDDDEMEDIPLDDEPEPSSKWQRQNFFHTMRDHNKSRSNSISDPDFYDDNSDSDIVSSPPTGISRRDRSSTLFDFSSGRRAAAKPSLLIGSQRVRSSSMNSDTLRSSNHYGTSRQQQQQQQQQQEQLSPLKQIIRVHLECEKPPQITLFTSSNTDEIVEIRIIVENLRSRQQFSAAIKKDWTVNEIRKAMCERQRLNPEEFEPLFESVDVPCSLDRTIADLNLSCIRLTRVAKCREDAVKNKIDLVCSLGDDIELSTDENEHTSRCHNIDLLIQYVISSNPLDKFIYEVLIYFVSYITSPYVLLKKLIDIFNTSSDNVETQQRILSILLFWIDENPHTIINTADTLHTFTTFLTTTITNTATHPDHTPTINNTLYTIIDHLRTQYFTSDLLTELSTRLKNALITKEHRFTNERRVLQWLHKELNFNISDSQIVFRNLITHGYLRFLDSAHSPAHARYYFADQERPRSDFMHEIVTEITPADFAYQMTLYLFNFLSKIDFLKDFSPAITTTKAIPSANLFNCCNKYFAATNKLALWMRWAVLSPSTSEGRIKALKWLIHVAEASLSIGSFGGADIAVSALEAAAVKRVKGLWAALPTKERGTLTEVCKQVRPNDGYRGYHSAVASLVASHLPVVPMLRVHLNEFIQAMTVSDRVCWKKLFFAVGPIKEVMSTQKVPYKSNFKKEVQETIEDICLWGDTLNDDRINGVSRAVEPLHDQEEELGKANLISIVNGINYVSIKK